MSTKPVGFELDLVLERDLISALENAIQNYFFKSFKEVGTTAISLIHGFPKSFIEEDFDVSDLEIYLGACRPSSLNRRLSYHRTSKGHEYGVLIGLAEAHKVQRFEKWAIKILKKLEEKNKLCVRNQRVIGENYDNTSPDEAICLYLTIKIKKLTSNFWEKPTKYMRDEIKEECVDELKITDEISSTDKRHIEAVVEQVHKETQAMRVYWPERHR